MASCGVMRSKARPIAWMSVGSERASLLRRNSLSLLHIFSIGLRSGEEVYWGQVGYLQTSGRTLTSTNEELDWDSSCGDQRRVAAAFDLSPFSTAWVYQHGKKTECLKIGRQPICDQLGGRAYWRQLS